MKYFILLAAIAEFSSAADIFSDEFINEINEKAITWKAGRNFHPDTDIKYLRSLLGVLPDSQRVRLPEISISRKSIPELPENFDAREQWPNCPTLREIRDQGGCGSCWTFSVAAAMSDRVCIHSNATKHFHFSAQHLVSCCHFHGYGCGGGDPSSAWNYWVEEGIVSGGPFNSSEGCQPYEFEPCEHHVNGTRMPCTDVNHTPKCTNKCTNSAYQVDFEADKHFGKLSYSVNRDEDKIRLEIIENGPVEASFDVYKDFYVYKSGVYRHVKGDYEAGHSVKIFGWGIEDGVKYWHVANSWNYDWGNNGTFKIIRGENHLGIERRITAGLPK